MLELSQLDPELSQSLLGIAISGSGSASVALADGQYQKLADWMTSTLAKQGTWSESQILDLDQEGARIQVRD